MPAGNGKQMRYSKLFSLEDIDVDEIIRCLNLVK